MLLAEKDASLIFMESGKLATLGNKHLSSLICHSILLNISNNGVVVVVVVVAVVVVVVIVVVVVVVAVVVVVVAVVVAVVVVFYPNSSPPGNFLGGMDEEGGIFLWDKFSDVTRSIPGLRLFSSSPSRTFLSGYHP